MLPPRVIDLYVFPVDAASRAAWILFIHLKVKFKLHKINSDETLELGHLPPGWPILKDKEFYVVQGNTVLRYIASKLDSEGILYPTDLETRTRVDMFLDWSKNLEEVTENVLEATTSYSPSAYQFISERRNASVDEIGTVMKEYIDMLRDMEKYFLRSTPYLAGDSLTIADVVAACQLMFSRVINTDISQFPRLVEWFKRVQENMRGWELVHTEFDAFVKECVQKQKLNSSHEQKIKKGKDAAGGNRQPDVYHTVYFQKPPEEVWRMFTQPNAPEWPGGVTEFSEKPGGKFVYLDGTVEGSNLYLQTNRRLLQSWRVSDWPAGKNSTVRINAEPEGQNGTQLIVVQQDVPPNFLKKTDELWSLHFWKPMGGVLVRNILQQLFFDNLSPHTMYRLLTDSAICSRLTKSKCEIGRGVGTEISLLDGVMTGKNVELITDVKIVQQVQFAVEGWPSGHMSTLTLEISRVAGGTTLVHTQENVPVGNFRHITEMWDKSFWKKMARWTEDITQQ